MTTAPGEGEPPLRRRLAYAAFGLITFFALIIASLGLISLLLDANVIEDQPAGSPQLGAVPGAAGVACALAAWLVVVIPALKRPGAGMGVLAGLAAAIAYVLAILVAAVLMGTDPARATAMAGRLITLGFAPAVAVAGMLTAVGATVAMRTSGRGTPRWPWERGEND